ncbi:MAG: hypothetical protein ABH862_03530 [Candidatus Omnitrophota bacterium]
MKITMTTLLVFLCVFGGAAYAEDDDEKEFLEEIQKAEYGQEQQSEFSEINEAQQTLLEYKKAKEEKIKVKKFGVTEKTRSRFSEFYTEVEKIEESQEEQEEDEKQVEKEKISTVHTLISREKTPRDPEPGSLSSAEEKDEEQPGPDEGFFVDETEKEEEPSVQYMLSVAD